MPGHRRARQAGLARGRDRLYLKALLHGLFDGPPADRQLRERLTRAAEQDGPATLHDRLAQLDPQAAAGSIPTTSGGSFVPWKSGN